MTPGAAVTAESASVNEKTSGVGRSSSAERGSQALRGSQAAWRRSQAPRRKQSSSSESSERHPVESRMTVNVSNELSSAGVAKICASPAPPAPMNRPSAPARAPQVCRRKMLRSSSSCGGGRVEQQAGSWLHSQLPAASPLGAASPRRRCRSADAPAEQPQ